MNLSFLEPLILADRSLTIWLHNAIPHNSFFDRIFSFFSLYGFSIAIWFVLLLVSVVFEEKRRKHFAWYLLGSVGLTLVFVEFVLKNLYGRVRPTRFYKDFLSLCPSGFSFPSGHAAVAFAAAYVFSHFDKKRSVYYYILAFLISVSRIYLGCHYIVDVVGGAIVGVIIGKIVVFFFAKKR